MTHSRGGWRSLKTVVAEHCHGEDEGVGWEHKLKASLVSIIHHLHSIDSSNVLLRLDAEER